MKVAILITIPEGTSRELNTLCFDTLRTGFPTADITVYSNGNCPENDGYIQEKCRKISAQFNIIVNKIHHADWIKQVIESTKGPLCIIDPDTIWWSSVEYFDFPSFIAGFLQPYRYSEFSQSVALERLHTHFLWIKDCQELVKTIKYPEQHEYSPCNPYMPVVVYNKGRPVFWDTCTVLYQMIGGSPFQEEHLNCYDHVNSTALCNTLMARIHGKDVLKCIHETAKTNPAMLKGLWKVVQKYEQKMNEMANNL